MCMNTGQRLKRHFLIKCTLFMVHFALSVRDKRTMPEEDDLLVTTAKDQGQTMPIMDNDST